MANFFKEISVPNQKRYPNSLPFPAVMTPAFPSSSLADFISVIESQKPYIESLLQKTGAILFRGFPVSTASQFNQVVEAFDYADQPYLGGSATRTHVVGRVFTSNESPPHQKIPFHHEMAYASEFPTKLFFFCEVEPGSGGETPIVLSYRIYERMKEKYPEFVTKLEKEGLIFNRVMTGEDDPSSAVGRGWKSTFSTDDRVVAQERATKLGMKLEWIDETEHSLAIKTVGPIPAFKRDKTTPHRVIWWNSLVASYTAFGDELNDPTKSVAFGNGEALPDDVVYDCQRIMDEESVAIPWQNGDVLLVDNLAVQHARKHFTPPRRVLAALCK
ncbi:Clavaminate synthase-like protein At3g21360 [Linum perenne]